MITTIGRFVGRRAMVPAIVATIGTFCRPAAAAQPVQYIWNVGSPSPTMMNDSEGYCWLGGVWGPFGYPTDYVNLTFDASWNWVFTGAQGPNEGIQYFNGLQATAYCLPWTSLTTSGTYNAYYGGWSPNDGSADMGAPAESMCSVEGIQGAISQSQYTEQIVYPFGYMYDAGPTSVWGQCAHLGSGAVPQVIYHILQGNPQGNPQVLDLGVSSSQMCTLNYIYNPAGSSELSTALYLSQDYASGQMHWYLNNNYGLVMAACIPIPQP